MILILWHLRKCVSCTIWQNVRTIVWFGTEKQPQKHIKANFPWICVVFFTAVKNCFTSDENTLSKKKDISCPTTSQANCSVNRMICSRFLSDYLEIFSAAPRKSLDNHSKTSHRSSCFPHSFFEVVEHEMVLYLFLFSEKTCYYAAAKRASLFFHAKFCFLIAIWCFSNFSAENCNFCLFLPKGRHRRRRKPAGRAALREKKAKIAVRSRKIGKTSN